MEKENLIKAYNRLKLELDKERHSETLRKYKILSNAYRIGIKIYGRNSFSIMKLALDFDLPYKTTKRILSLDKANKNTWEKINSGKISSFKVAQILLKKGTHYQDEMVNLTIEEQLSTYQIKSLRINSLKDIKKERLRISVEKGFSRSSCAYYSFNSTLDRLGQLLILDRKFLPEKKIPKLKIKLMDIDKKINRYLEKI